MYVYVLKLGRGETWEHVWKNCVGWKTLARSSGGDFRGGGKWRGLAEETGRMERRGGLNEE